MKIEDKVGLKLWSEKNSTEKRGGDMLKNPENITKTMDIFFSDHLFRDKAFRVLWFSNSTVEIYGIGKN